MFDLVDSRRHGRHSDGDRLGGRRASTERRSRQSARTSAARREIDARGLLVFPGLIDAHTHMALPVAGTRSSDDFLSGSRAAAAGGVTTIVDFTVGAADRTLGESIEQRLADARDAVVDYAFHAEVVGWQTGREKELHEAVGPRRHELQVLHDLRALGAAHEPGRAPRGVPRDLAPRRRRGRPCRG